MTAAQPNEEARETAARALREHLPPHQADRFWPSAAKALADAYLKALSANDALRAKLQRVRDHLKFEANSESGIVAEIDDLLASEQRYPSPGAKEQEERT